MKQVSIIFILIGLTMSIFTGCSNSDSNTIETDTNKYILNATENADVSLDAQILSVSTEEAQVKLTRDVENDKTMNVYIISGSVEITVPSTEEE